MTLFDNIIAVFILTVIAVIAYCKITDKTLIDLFKEIKEIIYGGTEEVVESAIPKYY